MNTNTSSGIKYPLKPAEESVPYYNWLSWLINFAIQCVDTFHLPKHIGNSYEAKDFWMVLITHALMNVSIDQASDRLNEILWQEENNHRRIKVSPREYQGKRIRRERRSPNGDQVRKYRNTLPKWLINKLNRTIFEQQIEFALTNNLITSTIDVLVDNTDEWYYGGDRYPKNPFITGDIKGPGTSRKRKYLGIMLKSGTTYLYCGVDIIQKKHSNVPHILETIDWLASNGFKIRYLIADRWFPTYELLSKLPSRGIHYIGPYKKWAPVKRMVEDYIKHGGKYIQPYIVKGTSPKYYKQPGMQVWLILTNRQGRRLREIRMDYKRNKKTMEECRKEIMVMVTTEPPPHGKKQQQGWSMKICRVYDYRWQIESGFRDLNRIAPPSNAWTNERKFFMRSVRYWIYNCWHLEMAKRRKLRRCPKSWRVGPTLRRFSDCALSIGVCG